jgi:hypothetical protein
MRTLIFWLMLSTSALAQVPPPVFGPPPAGDFTPSNTFTTVDGAYTINYHGDAKQPITTPFSFQMTCTPNVNCPAQVGFTYAWTGQAPISFVHTIVAGDTNTTVLADISAQYKSTIPVRNMIGAAIQGYARVRPLNAPAWFQIFQAWPFCQDPNISIAIIGGLQLAEGGGGCALEVGEFDVYYRRFPDGMPCVPNSIVWAGFFTSDLAGPNGTILRADAKDVDPMLGLIVVRLKDCITGKLDIAYSADTISFSSPGGVTVNGQRIGP